MYVYKPMAGHNLMQAIARVNRVFSHKVGGSVVRKEGGLVVDYVGIASALKRAMSDYTNRDKQNYGEQDIAKTALPKFIEKMEVCRDLLHGFNYSGFMKENASDYIRAKAISGGASFLVGTEKAKEKESFIKEALLLRQALSLCRSLIDA
jgi:type I restriction enzyme R subunit